MDAGFSPSCSDHSVSMRNASEAFQAELGELALLRIHELRGATSRPGFHDVPGGRRWLASAQAELSLPSRRYRRL